MDKSIFREGIRRTYILGIIFAVAASILGGLSLVNDNGQYYMMLAARCIPFIPAAVLVVLMRYLINPTLIDSYFTRITYEEKFITKLVCASQLYVWIAFFLSVVPFLIKDLIRVEIFIMWHSVDHGPSSFAILTLIAQASRVLGYSLLVTGITFVAVAVTKFSAVQLFLSVAVMVLPILLFEILGQRIHELFINIGNSYYFQAEKPVMASAIIPGFYSDFLGGIGIALIGVFTILIGVELIKDLRKTDTENSTTLQRVLHGAVCAILGLCFFLIAAYGALTYLADSAFVSFHGEASIETIDIMLQYGKITELRSIPMVFCAAQCGSRHYCYVCSYDDSLPQRDEKMD